MEVIYCMSRPTKEEFSKLSKYEKEAILLRKRYIDNENSLSIMKQFGLKKQVYGTILSAGLRRLNYMNNTKNKGKFDIAESLGFKLYSSFTEDERELLLEIKVRS